MSIIYKSLHEERKGPLVSLVLELPGLFQLLANVRVLQQSNS